MAEPVATVPVVSPEGDTGRIPADQAAAAQAQGFTPMSEGEFRQEQLKKEYGGLGGMARAGIEGGARGLTLGLSDLAATKLGDEETRKGMAARKELFPVTAGAGEVGGMLLPLALSGGTSAAAEGAAEASGGLLSGGIRAAGAIPRGVAAAGGLAERAAGKIVGEGATSLLGRVAQRAIPMAAGGAVEGAAYGAGQTISEAALGNEELTAEKLLAGAGHGALLGGLAGGGLGAISEAAKYGVEKLASKESFRNALQSFADERTIKATGALGSDIKRLGSTAEKAEERMHAIAQEVRDYRMPDGTKLLKYSDSAESLAPKLREAVETTGRELGALRTKLDGAIVGRPELAPDLRGFLQQVDERFAPALQSPLKSVRKDAAKALDEIAGLRAMVADGAKPVGFTDAYDVRRALDKRIFDAGKALKNTESLQAMRGMLEDAIETSADKAVGQIGDAALAGKYQELKGTFRNLNDAARISGNEAIRDLGRRVVSPSDYGVGAAGGVLSAAAGHGGIASAVVGGALSLAHKVVRERGSAAMAVGADALLSLGQLKHLSNSVDERIAAGVGQFLKGAPAANASRGFAAGADELVGGIESKGVQSAVTAKAANLLIGRSGHDSVRAQMQHVADLQANPQKMAEHTQRLVGNLDTIAPKIAAQLAAKEQNRVNFLASVAPKPSSPQSALGPQFDTLRYNDADVNRWLRTKALVYNPTLLIDELNRGHVSAADVAAVKATSPKLYEQIVGHITDELSHPDTKMTYSKKVRLGNLFGIAADDTMKPDFQAFIGNTYKAMDAAAATEQGGQGAPKGHNRGRPGSFKLDVSNIQTGLESVEGGGQHNG